jgi:transposase
MKEHAMSENVISEIAVVGIDIGKTSFQVIGMDRRGAVVLRQRWSRSQVEVRFANMPPCLIGMEACVGAHHLSRKLKALGHDTRLMPAKYVRPYSKGQKNDFRDAEAIAEAVQRPTMTHQGHADLPPHGEPARCSAPAWPHQDRKHGPVSRD